MCSDAPPPPAPDPAIGQAALKQAQLGEDYLAFAKEQFKESSALQKELAAKANEVSDYFLNLGKEDRARYESVFKPLEDEFVKTAKEYASPEKEEAEAARARADVQSAAAAERGVIERREQAVGVRPDAGRYAGIGRAVGLGTELNSVTAQNAAREGVRNKGLALTEGAINIGKGLPAQSAAILQSGVNNAGIPLSSQLGIQGGMQSGYGGAQAGYGAQANTLTNLYKGQLDAWNSQNQLAGANAQALGQFAGTAVGLAIKSSKKAKENRRPVPEGAALDTVERLPVESYDYRPGMGDGGRHVGPMAEDFAAATGRGDGRTIAVQDAIGLTMGAIKDLSAKVDSHQRDYARLRRALAQMIGLGRTLPRPRVA